MELNEGPFLAASSVVEDDEYLKNFELMLNISGFEFNEFRGSENLSLLGDYKKAKKHIKLAPNRMRNHPGAV